MVLEFVTNSRVFIFALARFNQNNDPKPNHRHELT